MLRKLAAALVFATGVALILLADAPFVRFSSVGNSSVCSVQQILGLPEHLDVLIMGSSRMRRGVDPAAVAAASNGHYTQVFNLARPGRDVVRNAALLEELVANGHSIDVLILEGDVDILRLGKHMAWSWTPVSAGIQTWRNVLLATPRTLHNASYVDPRLVLNGVMDKLQQALLIATTGIAAEARAAPHDQPIPICWRDDFDVERPGLAAHRERGVQRNLREFDHPDTDYDDRLAGAQGTRARVELQSLARIRAVARRANIKLIIVRPQGYTEPALSPRVVEALQRIIPEYRYPPEALSRRLAHTHMDANHFGPEGRALFSRWLAETAVAEQNRP